MNCDISSLHQCGSDKETDADLHFDHSMTIPGGIRKWESGCWLLLLLLVVVMVGGVKNGKSIAHFLLFCIEILMFAKIKVDKPGRSFEPRQL